VSVVSLNISYRQFLSIRLRLLGRDSIDKLTFVVHLVDAIAWPCSIIVLVCLVRKPVFELIPLVKKLKYKQLELEFSEGVKDLGIDATDLVAQTNSTALPLVAYSPRAAIVEAWIELESVAVEVASSLWEGPPAREVFRNYPKLGQYLYECEIIDRKELATFHKLRQLRNKATHAEELSLSETDAKAFVIAASNLTEHLRVNFSLNKHSG